MMIDSAYITDKLPVKINGPSMCLPNCGKRGIRDFRFAVILTHLTDNAGQIFKMSHLQNTFSSGMEMMKCRHLPSWFAPKLCLNSHHRS